LIIITSPPEKFAGELVIPGDKSITHRALLLGAIARGVTEIKGYLEAGDSLSTAACLRALGVKISKRPDRLLVEGSDMVLKKPEESLYAGNSGTTARLLLGILAGQNFSATLTGDSSLQKRPMKRVIEPLSLMGAEFNSNNDHLPLTIQGGSLKPISYQSPRSSAQVKSSVLLAGLYADGETVVEEPYQSRNHTELMLQLFGADLQVDGCRISVRGPSRLRGTQVRVPADISAAAFFMIAAAIVSDSEVLLKNIGINPSRSGIVEVLLEMGADLALLNKRIWGNEPVADIRVRGNRKLKGITIGGEMIPRLIDEIPVLAVAAALAEGKTVVKDAAELRVKESDRITALCMQLNALGSGITEKEDGFEITGGAKLKGAKVSSCDDHRIAMALAVAGLAAEGETVVEGAEVIGISFPGFMAALRTLVTK